MKVQKVCLCVRKEIYSFFYLCLVYIFESLKLLAMITGLHFLTDPMEGLGAMDTQNKDLLLVYFCFCFYGKVVQKEWGFSGGTGDEEPACKVRRYKRYRFHPWVRKIPWSRTWQPTPVLLSGEFQGQRGLAGYSP